jgi:5'-3' exonuclease
MGIKGLPEVLKPYLIPVEVSRHKGKRAAVDAYSWLHKGAYSCSLELATKNHYWRKLGRDPPYVKYCVHRAQMLRHFGLTPVIVFDGDRLPAKGGEEKERRDRRGEKMAKGHAKLKLGDKEGAAFFFQQGIDVTPAMAHELIAALKREGFEFIVAPYEADAQIAALAQLGGGDKRGVDVVFTEDSDLVAYGCPTVLFKLDKHGSAMELNVADVLSGPPGSETVDLASAGPSGSVSLDVSSDAAGNGADIGDDDDADEKNEADAAPEPGLDEDDEDDIGIATSASRRVVKRPVVTEKVTPKTTTKTKKTAKRPAKGAPLDFTGWSRVKFLELCVLSGCDFLPNVPSIGIKRAHALMATHGTAAATLEFLRADIKKKVTVPDGYETGFQKAFWTFRHARVWDPLLRRTRPLNPMPDELRTAEADTAFLGAHVEAAVALEVAEGRLDPITRKRFVVPASPTKQKGWKPGGGRGGKRDEVARPPPARPLAFANLFGSKPKPARTPTRFDDGDALDDHDMALMMKRMETQNENGAETGGGDGGGARANAGAGASRAPAAFPAAFSKQLPPTGSRESVQTPSVRSTLPKNMFARPAPAKTQGLGQLAGLFKKAEEKENGLKICVAEDTPATARPTVATVSQRIAAARAAPPPTGSVRNRGPMDAFAMLRAEAEKKKRKLT